jgi:23S rRNA pseudouridine2605 synthase
MTENSTPEGERIAKVLSRRGVASRREAERLIALGEVKVNGKTIDSPALNVTDRDRITVSGKPLPAREPARLWLYYKPEGLVTSASDEKGRKTVFDNLPEDLPRVMSIGRLDLNSEGLLLLTNDGEMKRRLELPSTGWLRKYRVRVNGNPTDPDLEPLRRGITVEGERFQPMVVILDRVQGANAWLTVGLREGKNREIRRAMAAIDLYVNRLIRISYGPFRLGDLEPGQVEEIKPKVLRDQLGGAYDGGDPDEESPRASAAKKTVRHASTAKPAARASDGPKTIPRAQQSPSYRAGLKEISGSFQDAKRGPAKPAGTASSRKPAAPGTKPARTERPVRPPRATSTRNAPRPPAKPKG